MIGRRVLFEKAREFRDAKAGLQVWLETTKAVEWRSLEDIRKVFPSADMVSTVAIFNIKGNHYRLIARMEFKSQRVYIKEFLTHAQYDKGAWKRWL